MVLRSKSAILSASLILCGFISFSLFMLDLSNYRDESLKLFPVENDLRRDLVLEGTTLTVPVLLTVGELSPAKLIDVSFSCSCTSVSSPDRDISRLPIELAPGENLSIVVQFDTSAKVGKFESTVFFKCMLPDGEKVISTTTRAVISTPMVACPPLLAIDDLEDVYFVDLCDNTEEQIYEITSVACSGPIKVESIEAADGSLAFGGHHLMRRGRLMVVPQAEIEQGERPSITVRLSPLGDLQEFRELQIPVTLRFGNKFAAFPPAIMAVCDGESVETMLSIISTSDEVIGVSHPDFCKVELVSTSESRIGTRSVYSVSSAAGRGAIHFSANERLLVVPLNCYSSLDE